jgi:hypothetical protein
MARLTTKKKTGYGTAIDVASAFSQELVNTQRIRRILLTIDLLVEKCNVFETQGLAMLPAQR